MQKYQQLLIFLTLFIAITYVEADIELFEGSKLETGNKQSTVYADHVQLVNLYFQVYRNTIICIYVYLGYGREKQIVGNHHVFVM